MSPHKLQNEHIKEIQKINNKNEPNSSFKSGFHEVTLGEYVANGLATKQSLIMHFGGVGEVGGAYVTKMAKCDHLQKKPYKSLKSQIWRLQLVQLPLPKHNLN